MPTPDPAAEPLWRVIPWDPRAKPGARFSPGHFPSQSGQGRFDLPVGSTGSALYLAGSGEHAIAEKIQDLRNRFVTDDLLLEHGHRLALCSATLRPGLKIADLCDPRELLERDIPPDRLAYRDRTVTQAISERLHEDEELAGFRWWSALFGEWHTTVLFSDRLPDDALSFGDPVPLGLEHTDLASAAAALAIEVVED